MLIYELIFVIFSHFYFVFLSLCTCSFFLNAFLVVDGFCVRVCVRESEFDALDFFFFYFSI